jgi:adenine phosphoribosyltransferase
MNSSFDFDSAIRKIPDFPKPGILFFDITSLLGKADAFRATIDAMVEIYRDRGIEALAAIEARGFLFAAPLADRLALPLILVRKKGKLPGETVAKNFSLEYGEDRVEIHKADIPVGKNVLMVDDLIATGGTVRAAVDLFREEGAIVSEVFSVIGLPFLGYREQLPGCRVEVLQKYDNE